MVTNIEIRVMLRNTEEQVMKESNFLVDNVAKNLLVRVVLPFWQTRALKQEKGSGKSKFFILEANVRSVHFLGRDKLEIF